MLGEAWTAVSALPWEHPMSAVLALALAQVAMGGFDNVYHHELKERLPWSTTAHTEQSIHCVRGALYTLLFACFAGVTPTGAAAYGLAGVLAVEATLTMYDFVTEDKTRWRFAAGLPPSERVTHTLLTLNYGALLALLGLTQNAGTGCCEGDRSSRQWSRKSLCTVLTKNCEPPELGCPVFAIESVPGSLENLAAYSSLMLPPPERVSVPPVLRFLNEPSGGPPGRSVHC